MTKHGQDGPATKPAGRRPRSRGRRWLRHAIEVAVVAAVAFWFVNALLLPWLVRGKVADALAGLGFPGARFDVERASFWGTRVVDLTTPAGDLSVGSMDIGYRPLAAAAGELDVIRLAGAQVGLSVRDGKASLALPASADAPSGGGSGGGGGGLPFRRLEVTASALHVDWDGRAFRVPVSGFVENTGGGAGRVELALALTPGGDLTLPGGGKLRRLSGVLNLGGTFRPDGGDAFLRDGSWIGFGALEDASGLTVGATRVALAASGDEPLATISIRKDGLGVRGSVQASSEGEFTLKTPDVDANLGRLGVRGTFAVEPGAPVSADVELRVDGAALTHGKSALTLAGISATVPVSVNGADRPPGAILVASPARGRELFEPVRGTLGVRDGRATFAASWAVLPDAVLGVRGWLEMTDGGVTGEVAAAVPSFQFGGGDEADALASLIPALDGWAVTGTFAADATLAVKGGRMTSRVTLNVTNAGASSKGAGMEFKGVTGAVTVDSLAPLATPAGQQVSMKRLAFGDVEMTDASVGFRVDPTGVLLIERVEAGWLGGRILTRDVRIDPASPRFAATLYAEELSLREILAFTAGEKATGKGVMSGELPIAIDWPRLRLGKGYLHSRSPAGELQFGDTQLLGALLEQSDPRFSAGGELAEVKDRVVRALTDFRYDRLTFDFEDDAPGGLVRINTHGKGRAGEQPQELDLTLNVRGGNDLLNHYLQAKTRWDDLAN